MSYQEQRSSDTVAADHGEVTFPVWLLRLQIIDHFLLGNACDPRTPVA